MRPIRLVAVEAIDAASRGAPRPSLLARLFMALRQVLR